MHFLYPLAALLLAFIIPAAATPARAAKRAKPEYAEPDYYFCNGADNTGRCFHDRSAFGTCVAVHDDFVAAPDEFGSSISTVTINNGTHCTLYRDARCKRHSRILLFGGEHFLFFKDFRKDMVSSFRCEEL